MTYLQFLLEIMKSKGICIGLRIVSLNRSVMFFFRFRWHIFLACCKYSQLLPPNATLLRIRTGGVQRTEGILLFEK